MIAAPQRHDDHDALAPMAAEFGVGGRSRRISAALSCASRLVPMSCGLMGGDAVSADVWLPFDPSLDLVSGPGYLFV